MDNKTQYRALCARHPGIPLFLQPWWLDAACGRWDVAIAKKGGEVTGVWPYPVEQKLGVSLLRNPVLTPYLGPYVFPVPHTKTSKADNMEHEVITNLIAQLPIANVWHLSVQPGLKQAGLFRGYGLQQQVQQTFLTDLQQDEAVLLTNMRENQKRNIKAGEKEITISDDATCLPELYQFQKHTLTGKGKRQPYTMEKLQRLFDACKAHAACSLFTAKKGGVIQAIVWNAWDACNSYYLMGGQNPAAGDYRAMSALLWHAMKESRLRGNLTFDLEGSMDPGVEHFFRGFGGKRELYLVLHRNESLLWRIKEGISG